MATLKKLTVTPSSKATHETGDWDEISRWIDNIPVTMKDAGGEVVSSLAPILADNVKTRLLNQTFSHEPLDKDYVKSKERNNLDNRILIATKGYIESIGVYEDGDTVFVGVPKELHKNLKILLSDLSDWLEFGTDNMPRRPHFTVEFERLRELIIKELTDRDITYLGVLESNPTGS